MSLLALSRYSPSRRLLIWLLSWLIFASLFACLQIWLDASAATLYQQVLTLLSILAGLNLFIIVLDIWLSRRPPEIRIQRKLLHNLPVNGWSEVELEIHHPYQKSVVISLCDGYPNSAEVKFLPQTLTLKPGQFSRISYRIRPAERGVIQFNQTQLWLPSRLGFWRIDHQAGSPCEVRVYPDFAAITRYQLLATDNRTSQLGIKRKPRRGEGLEFLQLRDYREGDNLRQIDWKATIRRDKLISREYQDERDQQILFLLDCGRTMRSKDDHLSHFDHALNAMLLLSYVALKQGDAVGLASFGGVQRWLSPVKGRSAVNTILNTVFDLQPTTEVADYQQAIQQLLTRQHKRALIIIISKIEEDTSELWLPLLQGLRRKHLVLVANLQEAVVQQTLQQPVQNFDDALRYLGANQYQQQRQYSQQKLQHHGLNCLDVTPQQLPVALVNRYLEIKRQRGL